MAIAIDVHVSRFIFLLKIFINLSSKDTFFEFIVELIRCFTSRSQASILSSMCFQFVSSGVQFFSWLYSSVTSGVLQPKEICVAVESTGIICWRNWKSIARLVTNVFSGGTCPSCPCERSLEILCPESCIFR